MSQLDDALGALLTYTGRLHRLKNTWPCGIRSVDDRTDADRIATQKTVEDLAAKVARLRAAERRDGTWAKRNLLDPDSAPKVVEAEICVNCGKHKARHWQRTYKGQAPGPLRCDLILSTHFKGSGPA